MRPGAAWAMMRLVSYECVVVGAGAAGVTTSRALADAGVEHVVLERGEVGHTWSTQRWDSFRLNTPGSMNSLLGDVRPDDYDTRDDTVRRLHQRADGLPVRTGVTVRSARREGDRFRIRTDGEELTARTVVVASGAKNVAADPPGARRLAPHLTSVRADTYRKPDALPEGGVLVVGGGQTGAQIAEDLAAAGREVWWSTSRIGRYRAHYRGRALLDWHVLAGWWAAGPETVSDPAALRAPTPLLASNGRDLGIPQLGRSGVRLLARLGDVGGTRATFVGDVAEFVTHSDAVAAALERVADDYIEASGTDAPPSEPDPGCGPVATVPCPTLDLDRAGITTVLWCTGFGGDFRWLPEVASDGFGMPLLGRDGSAADDPGIRFVGMPWQSTRASAILHGMPLDAQRAVDGVRSVLAGRSAR